jgi:hypothetical protein
MQRGSFNLGVLTRVLTGCATISFSLRKAVMLGMTLGLVAIGDDVTGCILL